MVLALLAPRAGRPARRGRRRRRYRTTGSAVSPTTSTGMRSLDLARSPTARGGRRSCSRTCPTRPSAASCCRTCAATTPRGGLAVADEPRPARGPPRPTWAAGPTSTREPYPGPVLWLAGADSRYVRPEYAPVMRPLFPRVQLVTVKDAGHWLHSDQPEVFLAMHPPVPASVTEPDVESGNTHLAGRPGPEEPADAENRHGCRS